MAKGQKTCPECAAVMGCRSKECKNCGYVFTKKTVTPTVQDDTQDDDTQEDEMDNDVFNNDVFNNDAVQHDTPKRKSRRSVWRGEKITVDILKAGCLSLYVKDEENMVSIEGPVIKALSRFEPNLKFNDMYAMIQIDLKNKSISVWSGTVFEGSPSIIISEALQ